MDVYSNIEKHWRRFPFLNAAIKDKSIPTKFYHNLGMMSPYTKVFDDLHDIAEIATVVSANDSLLAEEAERFMEVNRDASEPMPRELLADLEHLQSATRAFSHFFEERSRATEEVIHALYKSTESIMRERREQQTRGEQGAGGHGSPGAGLPSPQP